LHCFQLIFHIFQLISTFSGVKEPFIKFCRAHEKRLRLCVPFHRVGFAHPNEEESTIVSIAGFVMEWRGRGGLKAQTKSPVKVEMQFLEHRRKQFLAFHSNSMLNCAMSIIAHNWMLV
jgi:hypothetical protein